MATRDEVLGLARETRGAVLRGQAPPDQLTDKGKLLLRIGVGDVSLDALPLEQRQMLGMDPGLLEGITGSRGFQAAFGTQPPRVQGLPTKVVGQALKEGATGPTMTGQLIQRFPILQPPGPLNLAAQALGGVERGVSMLFSPIVGAGRLVEQAAEQVPRIAGQEPASTPVSRAAGFATELAGGFAPALRKPPVPSGKIRGIEVEPPPRLALPAGQPEAGIPIPREMVRPSPRALPAGQEQRALPPATRSVEVRGFQEPPPILPGRPPLFPGEEKVLPKRVEPIAKPLPTKEQVAQTRAGIDLTMPPERPTGLVDEFGKPVMVPRRARAEKPPAPEIPPEGPPPAVAPPPPQPTPQVPTGPPPVPELPPLGPPAGRRPAAPPPTRRPTPFQERTAHVDVGTVNLADPDEVLSLVRGRGGINFGALTGEARGIPLAFKNRKGMAFDELVDEVATAQSKNPKAVERDLLHTMGRYQELKRQQRVSAPPRVTEEMGFPAAMPDEVVGMFTPEEWAALSPQDKKGAIGFSRELQTQGRAEAAEAATMTAEVPEPPRFEQTKLGPQAVVPGTPGRQMPTTALRPEGKQKPPEGLFEKPEPPQERLFGVVPPVPLPGPSEEEEGTLPGNLQRAAQVAGIALPLAAMMFGRFRGGKKPPVQRPPGVPPEVPPQFRRETVRPQEPPGAAVPPRIPPVGESPRVAPTAAATGAEAGAGAIPPSPEHVLRGAQQAVRQAKQPEAATGGGEGGIPGPPRQAFTLPADLPADPMPHVSRTARFFSGVKGQFLSRVMPPEEVVKGDPGANSVVRLVFRRHEDGLLLKRELETKAREVYRGLNRQEVEQVNRILDTPGADDAMLQRALPPKLAEVGVRARREIFDAGADATGLPRERRITGYFPRFRDRIRVQETQLIQVGDAFVPKTYLEDIPKHLNAFFFKPRTADAPPNTFGLEGVLVYQRATARHLMMNGGTHPFTGEAIPGFLNEVQPLLNQAQPHLRGYVGELVNYFIGTPESRVGTPLANQLSRIVRNVEFSRTIGMNLGSPLANTTQQVNTLAWVSPTSYFRGYADLLDPQKRAMARHFLGLPEMAKADLELVQNVVTTMDRIEDITGRMAHGSGALFRASEIQGNRYHAFLAGLRDAESMGLQGQTALEYARDIVEMTQFPGAGPAKIPVFRGPAMALVGQFKQFQIRQALNVKNMIVEDVKEWQALLSGQKVPISVRGKPMRGPDGQVLTRAPRIFPRIAKYMIGLTALGGPDALAEGLDDFLREEHDIKIPGLFPALGVSISNLLGLGFSPAEITRMTLFFAPGPMVGHIQDALSAATGINMGRGLTELLRGDIGDPLTLDQRTDRALRGFMPVAGVTMARARVGLKQFQTPGEERAARTILEALGLEPATGPLLRRTTPGQAGQHMFGLRPVQTEREQRERQRLGDLDRETQRALKEASDHLAVGDEGRAFNVLRDAEKRLGLPPGSLEVSRGGEKEGMKRFMFTPLERQQRRLERRFPEEVEESRGRVPGEIPGGPGRRRIGVPRPGVR